MVVAPVDWVVVRNLGGGSTRALDGYQIKYIDLVDSAMGFLHRPLIIFFKNKFLL